MQRSMLRLVAAAGLSVVILSGCGGMPSIGFSGLFQSDVKAAAEARYANNSAEQALARAEETFAEGFEQKLGFYAPEHFEDAQDALENARKLVAKKAKDSDVFEAAYRTEKNIEDGLKIKAAVEEQLAEPLRYQAALVKRGTDKSFPKEYDEIMDDLADLIELIEAGKPKKAAEDLPQLVTDLRALEIKTIKFNALNPGQVIMARADKLDAKKIAPALYNEASANLQQADAFIQLNPYQEAKAAELSAAFEFAAKHLLHVVEETIALQGVDKKDLVWGIIQQEDQLLQIGKAMGHVDVRDLPLAKQAAALASKAAELREKEQEATRLHEQLAEAGKSQQALKGELAGLQDDSQQARQRIAELEAQLQAQLAAAENDKQTSHARVAELEQQLAQQSANAQGDALLTQTRIDELEKQLKIKSDDNVAAQARIRQLEQRLASSEAKAKKLQARVSALSDALNTEKARSSDLADELADAESTAAVASGDTTGDKPRLESPSL